MQISLPVPLPPLALGAGGLLPFAALAAAAWLAPALAHQAQHWLALYALAILSFVGALHWGIVMADRLATRAEQWRGMGWSVVPALAGWLALALPVRAALAAMAAAFVVHFLMDRRIAARHAVPEWYLRLRGGLSLGVVASLVAAALA